MNDLTLIVLAVVSIFAVGYMLGWAHGHSAKLKSIAPPDEDKP